MKVKIVNNVTGASKVIGDGVPNWDCSCVYNNNWVFPEGGPKESGMNQCPHCGREIGVQE